MSLRLMTYFNVVNNAVIKRSNFSPCHCRFSYCVYHCQLDEHNKKASNRENHVGKRLPDGNTFLFCSFCLSSTIQRWEKIWGWFTGKSIASTTLLYTVDGESRVAKDVIAVRSFTPSYRECFSLWLGSLEVASSITMRLLVWTGLLLSCLTFI